MLHIILLISILIPMVVSSIFLDRHKHYQTRHKRVYWHRPIKLI